MTMLIHAYAKAADVAGAQTTLRGMKRQQLHPNAQAFNGVTGFRSIVLDYLLVWKSKLTKEGLFLL